MAKTKAPPKAAVKRLPPELTSGSAKREPRASMVAGWNPDRIRQAEITCSSGNYTLAASLCESMMADERVSKCIDRLYSATTLPLTFEMPGKNAEQSKNDPVCQALADDWSKILPEDQFWSFVAWIALMRVALLHIEGWRVDPETGRALPIVKVWSPRNLRNDPTRGLLVRSASASGDSFGTEEQITPGDGNWIVVVFGANYRAPFQAAWRGLARWWLLKLYAEVDWASSSERHGQGQTFVSNTLTAGSAGLDTDVGDVLSGPRKQALARDIQECGRNGVIVLPRGWKADLVTDGAKTYETFLAQTNAANGAIDMALTGTNLTSEVSDNGSRAAAQVHESIDAAKFRGILELIATGFREQCLVFWALYNFASAAPYPKWDTRPPKDAKAEAEALGADATALKTYVDAGAQIDQVAWFERNGTVKLIEGASREIKKPVAPSPIAPANDTNTGAPPPKQPKKTLAFAAAAEPETAFARGREYADSLEDECCRHAAVDLAPTLGSVLAALQASESFDDAKQRLMDAYRAEPAPKDLLDRTEKALIMAQLAGAETIEQEIDE